MNIYFSSHCRFLRAGVLLHLILLIFIASSCKKQEPPIPKPIQDYLSNQGVQQIVLDLDYSDSVAPNKKYVSVTVTYNFSTAEGKPQKEFLGFILKSNGSEWEIERNTTYTVNKQKAKDLLAGNPK
jgi:hypothetical protein